MKPFIQSGLEKSVLKSVTSTIGCMNAQAATVGNCGDEEAVMVRIKVVYDAYNRTFKLVDLEFGSALQDGGLYELEVPLNIGDFPEAEEFVLIGAPLAHA